MIDFGNRRADWQSAQSGRNTIPSYRKWARVKDFWQKVKHYSQVVGDFQARLILTILYGVLVLPTGLIAKIGGTLLDEKRQAAASYWQARPNAAPSIRAARGQG